MAMVATVDRRSCISVTGPQAANYCGLKACRHIKIPRLLSSVVFGGFRSIGTGIFGHGTVSSAQMSLEATFTLPTAIYGWDSFPLCNFFLITFSWWWQSSLMTSKLVRWSMNGCDIIQNTMMLFIHATPHMAHIFQDDNARPHRSLKVMKLIRSLPWLSIIY